MSAVIRNVGCASRVRSSLHGETLAAPPLCVMAGPAGGGGLALGAALLRTEMLCV
jgi:hypothetical protein